MEEIMLEQINRFLSDNFSAAEIEDVILHTHIGEPQDFGFDEQSQTRGAIVYFDRLGSLPDFVTMCQAVRPDLDWGDLPAWTQIYAYFQNELTDEEILQIGEMLDLFPLPSLNLSQAFFDQAGGLDLAALVDVCNVVRPDLDWGHVLDPGLIRMEEDWELDGCPPEDESESEMWVLEGQTRGVTKNSGQSSSEAHDPVVSSLRLDVAVPAEVKMKRPFVLAVAIRQLDSPVLSEKHLDQVDSDDFEVEWPDDQDALDLTVEIDAPDCRITSDRQSPVRLWRDHDSPVLRFHLIAEAAGPISIIVTVFQDEYPLGSTWLESVATTKPLAQVETAVQSQPLVAQSSVVKLFDQIYSAFIVDELKTIAFRLNIDYEEFVRDTKSGTIRELILLCQRQKLVERLLETCRLFRPQFEWRLG
jgi:hypothetical protein